MAKRFGKYLVKKDKRGFNRYYTNDGTRISSEVFAKYQKQFLDKARKAGKKANDNVFRFPSTNPKSKTGSGKPVPKYLQRHFRYMYAKNGLKAKDVQQKQLNQWSEDTWQKVINFAGKAGLTAKESEVTYQRLQQQIPALDDYGYKFYYEGAQMPADELLAKLEDVNKDMINDFWLTVQEEQAQEEQETGEKPDTSEIKIYFHMFFVSYPEGEFRILGEGELVTNIGTFPNDFIK